tara:strand:- start:1155 stop:1568 length:414 start_codon:yes stop_codon:yes gene_type:complete
MSDREHQELTMLYQVTVSDLSYFKTQQWAVATYAFLLYAGLVGAGEFVSKSITCYERTFMSFLCIAVLAAACTVIFKLQDSIAVRQARLEETKKHFGQPFHDAWKAKEKGKEYIRSVWFLYSAVVFGAIVVLYMAWR